MVYKPTASVVSRPYVFISSYLQLRNLLSIQHPNPTQSPTFQPTFHHRTPYLPNLSSIFLLSLSFTSLTSSLLASYATLT